MLEEKDMRKIEEILTCCDHTLLAVDSTWDKIKAVCDDGIKFNTASVCIPPSFVKRAKEYVKDALKICTVVGFPNGYSTTASKIFETADAIKNGADEIDTVINVGMLKEGDYAAIIGELAAMKAACGDKIFKVIIETCLLTEEEKIKACELVAMSGADYIKTSTGFAGGGATPEDVKLLREHSPCHVKVKAAGGISSLEDADEYLTLGAERLGTSRIVKLAKNEKAKSEY